MSSSSDPLGGLPARRISRLARDSPLRPRMIPAAERASETQSIGESTVDEFGLDTTPASSTNRRR